MCVAVQIIARCEINAPGALTAVYSAKPLRLIFHRTALENDTVELCQI
ncbi:MAG: hypothetical protein K2P28_04330 [Lachnospiraceae bacterium]|nr:hypothetical protein [Lachnospiraceae bacterium]